MLSTVKLRRLISRIQDTLWLKPALASLVSMLTATAALWVGRTFEAQAAVDISEDSLVGLLGMFASGMLSVATFTVSAIVAAASSAASSTTPRAARFVVADSSAQNVLSAFIAAFIYSLVAIIALKAFSYGNLGRFILFLGLILMVAFVLVSFIRWVDHAMRLGRQSSTIEKLADAARDSMRAEIVGTFGARVWDKSVPAAAVALCPKKSGYVTSIDVDAAQKIAAKCQAHVVLPMRPGEFCLDSEACVYVTSPAPLSDDLREELRRSVEISPSRHQDFDVRFNILNLTETADRALSPAVNDPGTAIHIVNVLTETLMRWVELRRTPGEVSCDRVSVPRLEARELLSDAFVPIARDGAGVIEVGIRLQKALRVLGQAGDDEISREVAALSRSANELAQQALKTADHRNRIADLAGKVGTVLP